MKTLNKKSQRVAILLTILAAALYAISTPVSKVMLQVVPPTMVAAFLYLGAGIGVGTMMLGATICWGLENNCTRQIADRDPMEIVTIKGFGSGLGALAIALAIGALLSILLLGEPVTLVFTAASLIMAVGCWIAAK